MRAELRNTSPLILALLLLSGAVSCGGEKWWSLQPVREPTAGETIDGWIQQALEVKGLQRGVRAEDWILTRRAAFALTGLPPQAVGNDVPGDFASEVDQLLASPHFGERWARHWMDVVRFAESKGHEYDYAIPGAWRYRDYLIRALNADVPWPQVVREHLIGDLVEARRLTADGKEEEGRAAAMWWLLGESASSPVDLPNDEGDRLDNQVEVFGKAFLGLTVSCARCHNHKFDPISQQDYQAMAGVMASMPMERAWGRHPAMEAVAARLLEARAANGETATGKTAPMQDLSGGRLFADMAEGVPEGWRLQGFAEPGTPLGREAGLWTGLLSRKLPASLRSPTFLIEDDVLWVLCRGRDATALVSIDNLQVIRDPIYNELRQAVDQDDWHWRKFSIGRWKGRHAYFEIFTGKVDQPLETEATAQNQWAVRAVVLGGQTAPALPVLPPPGLEVRVPDKILAELEREIPAADFYLTVAEPAAGRDLPLAIRGDAKNPGSVVPRGFLQALQPAGGLPVKTGSGRREWAEQVLAPSNPLTDRVFVNRVWHWLFGQGLVASPDDFGKMGVLPSHPELLDLLAWHFRHRHGGSVKGLIREILLTETWQQASAPASPESDARNLLLSHFPLRRLEAEAVRDNMLAVSGRLDRRVGGPSTGARPRAQFYSTSTPNQTEHGSVDGEGRRSLYVRTRRNYPDAFLTLFDLPAPVTSFGRRDVSNVPAQALALLNDPLPNALAAFWAEQVAADPAPGHEKIAGMIRQAFHRNPQEGEVAQCGELLGPDPDVAAWSRLALAFFNLKEFIWVR